VELPRIDPLQGCHRPEVHEAMQLLDANVRRAAAGERVQERELRRVSEILHRVLAERIGLYSAPIAWAETQAARMLSRSYAGRPALDETMNQDGVRMLAETLTR
jgi:hypothetical protein